MKKSILLLGLSVIALLSACGGHEEEKEENTRLLVTSPLQKDTTLNKEYVCQIHSIQHIELRALERGYLQEIYVDEGQFVKKGKLMFRIMPLFYQAETEKAQAEADFAQIEYQNTKSLAENNVVSKNELALAKAKYDKAKAELTLAKTHLQFTEVRAPFDGYMDHFHVRLGSLVEEGELLTTLSDNSKMWVYFNVPEAEYLNYQSRSMASKHEIVQLQMANGQIFNHKGVIETIEADFNNETGNIAFRANFPNPEGLLRHGETGNILMKTALKNKMIIPQKATFEVLEKKYVFVVDKDHIVHQREIVVAAEMPDLYVLSKGLREGERFLLEGIRKVRNGDKVTYSFESPEKVISKLNVYVE